MREMIGVVKYTCDFCGGTVTKPSSTVRNLPAGWDTKFVNDAISRYDRCPSCKEEQNANK